MQKQTLNNFGNLKMIYWLPLQVSLCQR